jgi:hypothetical protein
VAEMSPGNGTDLAGIDDDALVAEVTRIGAHIGAATARLLDLVAEADRRGVYADWGAKSPGQWLSWLTGFAPGHAREHVFVAEALADFPATKKALSSGAISFCQAKAITKTGAPGFDDDLARLARDTTTAQLQAISRGYRRSVILNDPDGTEEVHERRYLDYFFDDDESLVLRGRLARDDGAIVKTALDAAHDELFRNNDDETPPSESNWREESQSRLRADALVAIAQGSLSATGDVSSGDCHQVVVHVDVEALTATGDGRIEIDEAGAVPPEIARRISCDASLVTLIENRGRVVGVGRRTRKIPRAVRRALKARDKMCRFPGCANPRILDGHHMRHWTDGGETTLDNLVLLCRWHHRLVHERNYTVSTDSTGKPVFRSPHGYVIDVVAKKPAARAADVVVANEDAGIEVDRPPEAPMEAATRMNLPNVVYEIFYQPACLKKLPKEVYDKLPPWATGRDKDPPPGGG